MLRLLAIPFWNPDEGRPRAALRIGVHLAFVIAIYAASGFALTLVRRAALARPELQVAHAALFFGWAALVIGSVWLASRFLDRRAFLELGLVSARRAYWVDCAFGLGLGFLLMAGILAVEDTFGLATYVRRDPMVGAVPRLALVPVAFCGFVAVAVNEEIVFRGYHLTNMAEGFGGRQLGAGSALIVAVGVSSGVFGLFHAGNPSASAMSTGNIALAGVMLAAGYVTTRSLAIPIGLHLGWNFFQNLFGMPVSGSTQFFFAALMVRTDHGPAWITGGRFGPEAGMTGLVAIVLGTLAVLLWVRLRYGALRLRGPADRAG